jgi:retron-type reverse transcriptase
LPAATKAKIIRLIDSPQKLKTAYAKCRRKKRSRPEAAAFDFAWEEHLLGLQRELIAGTYRPGEYHNFYAYNPKRRKISAAPFRDRVVHHAVVRVLEPFYERRFLYDSYACRRHKGTHRAIDRAERYLRRHRYYLKTDLVKFFPNVDHGALLDLLSRRIRDARLMELIRLLVTAIARC